MSTHAQLATRPLGRGGPQVVRMGLGLMGSSGIFGLPASEKERLEFLDRAYAMGETFWDTADLYGDSEDLLGKWFAANPEKRNDIFLATKFGGRSISAEPSVDSSPEYCRQAVEKSLGRLGISCIDLYYVHRLDKVTPIEKTMEEMVKLKKAGKIKYIGLSECSAESLRRAHAIHPVSCVQMEYNPFSLEIESPKYRILQVARELGVAIVTYSPLALGLLTGAIRSRDDVSKPGDVRAGLPWLSEENVDKNMAIVDQIDEIAKAKRVSLAQLTLAWILKQGDDFFPIPGTTSVARLASNLHSLEISVTDEEDKAIRAAAKGVAGNRMPEAYLPFCFADTPALEV